MKTLIARYGYFAPEDTPEDWPATGGILMFAGGGLLAEFFPLARQLCQVLLELVERLDLQNVRLVVQDWGGLIGLTLPMEAPKRYTGLLVMNTMLATGDTPLSPGFLAWRQMCANKPDFDVGRLLARGNPDRPHQ